ncbi:MAG: thiamine phosphate synthase [Gammaproteobacteria bacterium]|nr:thiamine phosphate synthase [Gammaproteobacteria bacterium]MBU0847998.1 thiamine phosphate synthase [Gammaproteobacteria bacterium]MBU1529784.1 thiamine phosphate synthase [Gammaproteobacteria bacterium]MBU1779965.1 thiamine phosphate synthase [Gammaproteobacteria bacterium]MBU2088724.1 thiamine phosphate synthase [Gammaproteobacteria bacterium]
MRSDLGSLIQGVYAVTPERSAVWPPDAIVDCVGAALDGGVRLFQCRQKNWDQAELIEFVEQLNALCEKYDAALILNDVPSAGFSKFEGAAIAGVHLGQTDEPIAQARSCLGAKWVVGASCYNRFDLAEQAVRDGASYVAFGAMYPSGTKPNAVRAELELFANARVLGVPTVAIGGITLARVPELMAAGAHAVAVVNGLFGMEPDAAQVCRVAQQWVDAVNGCT